jgi:hypothetical protein
VRRSELLKVTVHCPHFRRPVAATRNAVIDRLVACDESDACRDPAPPPGSAAEPHARPFPRGCPVFPALAK